jgi:hypothetical protein
MVIGVPLFPLVRGLFGFVCLRTATGFFGLGFLQGGLALRAGLVLLCLTLGLEAFVTSNRPGGLLGLALQILDDSFYAFTRS